MNARGLSLLGVVCLVVLAGCGTGASSGVATPTEVSSGESDLATAPSPPESTQATPTAPPNGTLDVHFINVGQGASTLIVGPTNETMLVDSGDWSDDGKHVLSYLENHGIERVDYLVTTHADADHIGGHAAVIDYFETESEGVGAVYDPGITASSQTYHEYLDEIEEHNVTLYETRAGDRIPFEGVRTQILSPPDPYLASGDRNENSIVLRLGFGQSSFLLLGDAEAAGEQHLVDRNASALNATVLNVGHHGSRSSSSNESLDAVRPRIAVISSAYDSQYGHPHQEVLRRLAQRSVQTYWTATHGNVRVTSNGSAVTVATQRDAPSDPLALRNGTAIEPGVDGDVQNRGVVWLNGSSTPTVAPDGGATNTATSTSTATTTESAASTGQSGDLSVAAVHEDAAGDEYDNLNDEYLVFENTGDQPLELSGWTVTDEADHRYTFPSGFTLAPGAQVTLHTGSGSDSSTDLYWGSGAPVWNNDGDTVVVESDEGTIVVQEAY